MLSREGRQYMEIAPRLAVWPGLCLTVVVYSLNMFGDAVRDRSTRGCAAAAAGSAPRRAGGRKSRGDSTARAEVTPDRGARRREAGRPVSGRRWPDVIPGARGRGDR